MAGEGGGEDRGVAGAGLLDLDRYVPGLLTFVANKLARSATAQYQREFGVSVTVWRIMSLLAIEPGIPATRICHVIGFDKGPVSRTLAGMEEDGLIAGRDDPNDARRRLISLTSSGRILHDRIIPVALERERRLLACLTKEQRADLIVTLHLLHANVAATAGPGPD